jgi:hypothetical protein
VRLVHVGNGIADQLVRAQVLREHVDVVLGEDAVDLREHTGDVLVDVQDAPRMCDIRPRHIDFREIDARERVAAGKVVHKLAGDKIRDVLLGFLGTAADVGCEQHVGNALER